VHDVFISYARQERAAVELIKERLEQRGLSVFFDADGLDGGDQFPDVIDHAVKSAKCVLGVWSPLAITRPWVKNECRVGFRRGVLITAALSPVDPDTIPTEFGAPHLISVHDETALWRAILAKLGEDPTARAAASRDNNERSIGVTFDYWISASTQFMDGIQLYWGTEHAQTKSLKYQGSDAMLLAPLLAIPAVGLLAAAGAVAKRSDGLRAEPKGPQAGWPRARELLERAARLGHPTAMEHFAIMLERGHGGAKDEQAASLWRNAAKSLTKPSG
jgi:hypothetical protein